MTPNNSTESPPVDLRGVAEALSYAASHGIIMSSSPDADTGTSLCHAPMTYQPSPVDRACFQNALSITPSLNTLIHRIAHDKAYLRTALAETATADAEFTGRLLGMLDHAPARPSVEFSVLRFDYFVNDAETRALRMVEMNCIAASLAALSYRLSKMHAFLATHPSCNFDINLDTLPQNNCLVDIVDAFALAHKQYVQLHNVPTHEAAMVMLVQPGERNAYDQDILRTQIWEAHKIRLLRVTLREMHQYASLQDDHIILKHPFLSQPVLVTVVYYRAGYTPDDYPSEKEWAAREMIESSLAAKCPSAAVQLVGTKKIQQILDKPGQVERFVHNVDEAAAIRATFARQYSLGRHEGGDQIAQMAIDNPNDYVLKPQREGGRNNMYDEELKRALQSMTPEERPAYVLMERIRPVVVRNTLLRNAKAITTDVVSELGVYGVHVLTAGKEVRNASAGTLMRSKSAEQDDGGLVAGIAVLDSPRLVE